MLSNTQHTCEHILPRLTENLAKHGYPDMENVLQVSYLKLNQATIKINQATRGVNELPGGGG